MIRAYIYLFTNICISHYISVYGQEIPQIAKEILPEIKRVGETGMLNCTITDQGNNKVSIWYTYIFVYNSCNLSVL